MNALAKCVLLALALSTANAQAPFNDTEIGIMQGYFMANVDIQGTGSVVASPDPTTPGGSYYYDWTRDAALTMNTVLTILGPSEAQTQLQHFVEWVLRIQAEQDPNGVDVRIEPKFLIPSGKPYTGGWCRPQTDGPALRARTLINYANALLKAGDSAYVVQYLFNGTGVNGGGAIKRDLQWVVNNWQSSGCDLWEEVQSTDFFWNRFNMKNTLFQAASLATALSDSQSAATYTSTAVAINNTIEAHYNGMYIFESTNRPKDGATICALNDGYSGDGLFSPTSSEVAGTISTLNEVFHSAFPINSADDNNGIPGILYGRYPGDTYGGGNPWLLTSCALAQLYYRGAAEALEVGLPSKEALERWQSVLGPQVKQLDLSTADGLSRAMVTAGDGVLLRVRYHVAGAGFHLSEQLDKNTGYETSATDLTWSYATMLKALHARQQAMTVRCSVVMDCE